MSNNFSKMGMFQRALEFTNTSHPLQPQELIANDERLPRDERDRMLALQSGSRERVFILNPDDVDLFSVDMQGASIEAQLQAETVFFDAMQEAYASQVLWIFEVVVIQGHRFFDLASMVCNVCIAGRVSYLQVLLVYGANPNSISKCQTALNHAIRHRRSACVECLLQHPDICIEYDFTHIARYFVLTTPLFHALMQNNVSLVRRLLKMGHPYPASYPRCVIEKIRDLILSEVRRACPPLDTGLLELTLDGEGVWGALDAHGMLKNRLYEATCDLGLFAQHKGIMTQDTPKCSAP